MKSFNLKNLITKLMTVVILLNPILVNAQADNKGSNLVDESIQDLAIVMGAGAVGAVLGLSTLSFAETPKDHLKNVAIGGAIGVVIGVGLVVFGQANKSSAEIGEVNKILSPESLEGISRLEFSQQKIANSYLMQPTFEYNFTF
jgi:hypothetical protein